MASASTELTALAEAMLELATTTVLTDPHPLVPFALVEDANGRTLQRFTTSTLEEANAATRAHVRANTECHRAAVTWDGYLTTEGKRQDAVFVEASETGSENSVIIAQTYAKAGKWGKKAKLLGEPAVVGAGEPLL